MALSMLARSSRAVTSVAAVRSVAPALTSVCHMSTLADRERAMEVRAAPASTAAGAGVHAAAHAQLRPASADLRSIQARSRVRSEQLCTSPALPAAQKAYFNKEEEVGSPPGRGGAETLWRTPSTCHPQRRSFCEAC